MAQYQEKKTHNKKPIRYGKIKGTKESSKFAKIDVANNEEFAAKYSRNDSGQAKYGGWTPEGIALLVQLMGINKNAPAKPETKSIEQECLDQLRLENGIVGNDWEEHQATKKGKKRAIEQVVEVPGVLDYDEFDEFGADVFDVAQV